MKQIPKNEDGALSIRPQHQILQWEKHKERKINFEEIIGIENGGQFLSSLGGICGKGNGFGKY